MATATKKSKSVKAKVTVNGKTTLRNVRNVQDMGSYWLGEITVQGNTVEVTRTKRARVWLADMIQDSDY